MDSAKISDWLQVVGMFGVIASLIFVGLEMRQTQRIALSEAYQTRTEIERANIMDSASLPEFRSAIAKLNAGADDELTPEELLVLQWSMASAVTLWENDHFQYVNGYLSEEHWAKTYANLRCDLANPVQARLIETWAWRASFLEVIDRAKADNLSDPICWKN